MEKQKNKKCGLQYHKMIWTFDNKKTAKEFLEKHREDLCEQIFVSTWGTNDETEGIVPKDLLLEYWAFNEVILDIEKNWNEFCENWPEDYPCDILGHIEKWD